MRLATVIAIIGIALVLSSPAAAAPVTKITHWEMELSLMRHGVAWDDGFTTVVDDAYCAGFGPRLTRPARYLHFVCRIYGFKWVTACDDPVFFDEHIDDTVCDMADENFEATLTVTAGRQWRIQRLP